MIDWSLESAADLGVDPDAPLAGVLSEEELLRLASLKVPSRRRDWLLGRVAAKRLVKSWVSRKHGVDLPLDHIVVDKAPTGAPVVRLASPGTQQIEAPSLSISHRDGWALCALSDDPEVIVGADLELVEPRKRGFVRDFFTKRETELVDATPALRRDAVITAIWSAKEAVLKVLELGLTVDTREVDCALSPEGGDWAEVEVQCERLLPGDPRALRGIDGWWRRVGPFVVTLAAARRGRQQ